MARRNISGREDIRPDALRQRRDLYAIAIGLMLFYAAGGGFSQDANVGSMFAVHLKRPEWILVAAWAGFFYFWLRFWLVTEARPIVDFIEDVRWQAGDSRTVRRIAAQHVTAVHNTDAKANQRLVLDPQGVVPLIFWKGLTPSLKLDKLWNLNPYNSKRSDAAGRTVGGSPVEVTEEERKSLRLAWAKAIPRAAIRERTFTDYTLPHLFAITTVVVAISVTIYGHCA